VPPEGLELLQRIAERVIARYLVRSGMREVTIARRVRSNGHGSGVDITYARFGRTVRAKVKADPYCGADPLNADDRSLPFYRPDKGEYALEFASRERGRRAGWALESEADELFYYFVAIAQTEEELAELVEEDDEVFFPRLRVVRDDLRIVPMDGLRTWFRERQGDFASRPVQVGERMAWYRLIPRVEFERSVEGIAHVGGIYESG
jgi:hypothetical protein